MCGTASIGSTLQLAGALDAAGESALQASIASTLNGGATAGPFTAACVFITAAAPPAGAGSRRRLMVQDSASVGAHPPGAPPPPPPLPVFSVAFLAFSSDAAAVNAMLSSTAFSAHALSLALRGTAAVSNLGVVAVAPFVLSGAPPLPPTAVVSAPAGGGPASSVGALVAASVCGSVGGLGVLCAAACLIRRLRRQTRPGWGVACRGRDRIDAEMSPVERDSPSEAAGEAEDKGSAEGRVENAPRTRRRWFLFNAASLATDREAEDNPGE